MFVKHFFKKFFAVIWCIVLTPILRTNISSLATIICCYSEPKEAFTCFGIKKPSNKVYRWFSAERMGFEPMRPWRQTVFKTAPLWPLRYLSIFHMFVSVSCLSYRRLCYNSIGNTFCQHIFQTFFAFFYLFLSYRSENRLFTAFVAYLFFYFFSFFIVRIYISLNLIFYYYAAFHIFYSIIYVNLMKHLLANIHL